MLSLNRFQPLPFQAPKFSRITVDWKYEANTQDLSALKLELLSILKSQLDSMKRDYEGRDFRVTVKAEPTVQDSLRDRENLREIKTALKRALRLANPKWKPEKLEEEAEIAYRENLHQIAQMDDFEAEEFKDCKNVVPFYLVIQDLVSKKRQGSSLSYSPTPQKELARGVTFRQAAEHSIALLLRHQFDPFIYRQQTGALGFDFYPSSSEAPDGDSFDGNSFMQG